MIDVDWMRACYVELSELLMFVQHIESGMITLSIAEYVGLPAVVGITWNTYKETVAKRIKQKKEEMRKLHGA